MNNYRHLLHVVKCNCLNIILNIASVPAFLLPVNKKKIVIDNFLGKGYGDSPKYICEQIFKENKKYTVVWLVNDISYQMPSSIKKVKYGSLQSYYEMITSKFWIDNVRNSIRPHKRRSQVYIQTWHGSEFIKKVEGDSSDLSREYVKAAKKDGAITDAILSDSKMASNLYKKYYWLSNNTEILEYGLPRYDWMFNKNLISQYSRNVRQYIGCVNEGVIIYAPTFRDNGETDCYNLDFELIRETFEKKFKRRFFLLIRLHPNVPRNSLKIYGTRVIDFTDWDDSQELLAASDFMISDFSGMMLQFYFLKKPVFGLAVDKIA